MSARAAPKPKAAAKAAPAAAEPPKTAEPAPEPAAAEAKVAASEAEAKAAPEAKAAESAEGKDEKKKTRTQVSKILDVSVSHARCASHLRQALGDPKVEQDIKDLRKQMVAAKAKNDNEAAAAAKATLAEKTKTLVRLSNDTSIASAVMWDQIIKELLVHGMIQAEAQERRIVEVSHLHSGKPEDLLLYPMFYRTDTWLMFDTDHEDELKKERAAANKAAKVAKEAKKAAAAEAKDGKPEAKKGKAKKPEIEEEEDADVAEHGGKTTFLTYVESALKAVKKEEAYKTKRVSNRVREYLADLVAHGIQRQAMLARIIVQDVDDVRTMNAGHLKAVAKMLMTDCQRSPAQIGSIIGQIETKIAAYHEHLKSEKSKKESELEPAIKAENARKKQDAEISRKKKQADNARKRAALSSKKADDLAAEIGTLAAAAPEAEAAA